MGEVVKVTGRPADMSQPRTDDVGILVVPVEIDCGFGMVAVRPSMEERARRPQLLSFGTESDGSVIAEWTKDELAARCDMEEVNVLGLNLAHEIVTGVRSVAEACQLYAEGMQEQQKHAAYLQGFRFQLRRTTQGDPDREILALRRASPRHGSKGAYVVEARCRSEVLYPIIVRECVHTSYRNGISAGYLSYPRIAVKMRGQ